MLVIGNLEEEKEEEEKEEEEEEEEEDEDEDEDGDEDNMSSSPTGCCAVQWALWKGGAIPPVTG